MNLRQNEKTLSRDSELLNSEKKERLAVLEKMLRNEYKLRTGKEAGEFCAL